MKFINGWKNKTKQRDKLVIELRIGYLTIFEVQADLSDRKYRIGLFNFAIGN
jgi:hypothetical protein